MSAAGTTTGRNFGIRLQRQGEVVRLAVSLGPQAPTAYSTRGGFLLRHDEDLREPLVRRQGIPNPGLKPGSPALQGDSLPTELQGKPLKRAETRCRIWKPPRVETTLGAGMGHATPLTLRSLGMQRCRNGEAGRGLSRMQKSNPTAGLRGVLPLEISPGKHEYSVQEATA